VWSRVANRVLSNHLCWQVCKSYLHLRMHLRRHLRVGSDWRCTGRTAGGVGHRAEQMTEQVVNGHTVARAPWSTGD
jgi:hypothetical protein